MIFAARENSPIELESPEPKTDWREVPDLPITANITSQIWTGKNLINTTIGFLESSERLQEFFLLDQIVEEPIVREGVAKQKNNEDEQKHMEKVQD